MAAVCWSGLIRICRHGPSKYKGLYERIKKPADDKGRVSVLDEIDFQLDLLHSDYVNQDCIMALLNLIAAAASSAQKAQCKKALIKKIINQQILRLLTGQSIQQAFKHLRMWKGSRPMMCSAKMNS